MLIRPILASRSIVHFLPSMSWLCVVVIPFLYSADFFPKSSLRSQAFGIFLFTISFVVGDISGSKQFEVLGERHNRNFFSTLWSKPLEITLSCFVVLVPLSIYLFSKQIPLLELIRTQNYGVEVAEARAKYTKTEVPYLLSILGNLVLNILAPYLIINLFYRRNYLRAILLLFWSFLFALSSAAQGPFVYLLLTFLICLMFLRPDFIPQFMKTFVVLLACFFVSSSILFANHVLDQSHNCNLSSNIQESPANLLRSCDLTIESNYIVARYGYRIFLVPVEVSNYWYQEFSRGKTANRGILELIQRNENPTTANLIGVKYYVGQFPLKYSNYIQAYASIDADAYSIGGLYLVFIVAAMLLLIRIYLLRLFSHTGGRIFLGITTSMLTYFPFSASIQAIVFSHGLGLILVVAGFLSIKSACKS